MKSNAKKMVVAVSGGFDPPHIGHVRLFKEAKRLGDELVVILNNDNWLHTKKGYVFMPQKERKEVLEAMGCVDKVILTSHPVNPKDMSVCSELRNLRPNIFANGGDRNKKNVPEASVCNAISCRMVFNVGRGGKIQSSSWLLDQHKKRAELEGQTKALLAKKVIAFDLDGTLTESKSDMDKEMASLLCSLLLKRKVAVMGGGNREQFQKQLLDRLPCNKIQLENLFILPTSGASFFKFQKNSWEKLYQHHLSKKEKTKVLNAFKRAFNETGYTQPKNIYGETIEDRESQITFSALGQGASLNEKEGWNRTMDARPNLKIALEKYLPEFEVRLGGLTSIDITQKGLDKAYGMQQIIKALSISKKDVAYIGDALYEGGNDAAVLRTGIDTIQVSGPKDTKYIIRSLLTG